MKECRDVILTMEVSQYTNVKASFWKGRVFSDLTTERDFRSDLTTDLNQVLEQEVYYLRKLG
jgi:hypothetical protein